MAYTSSSVAVTITEGTDLDAAISPDQSTLVFGLQNGLWRMPAQGGEATRLNEPEDDFVRPDWSPDGNRVVFQAYTDNNFHIMTMAPDGSDLQALTSGQYDDRGPVYSPAGTRIAFASDRSDDPTTKGNSNIWVLDIASGDVTQWTDNPESEYQPTWSPDGTQIAYTVSSKSDAEAGDGQYSIQATDAAGNTSVLIRQPTGQINAPSWSPDGSQIAYTLLVDGNNHLYVDDSQVSDADEDVFNFRPRWLSDSTLLYTSDGQIQRRDLDAGSVDAIPFEAKISFDRKTYSYKKHEYAADRPAALVKGIVTPAISPDGNRVAFVALNDLWVMDIGSAPQQITDENADYISWRGDSQQLMYVADGVLRTISASGGNAQTVPVDLTWTPQPPEGRTVIYAGQFWDGTSQSLRSDVDIDLQDDRIVAIRDHEDATPANDVRYIDASDLTVMPGLTEGHMHREWVPYVGARLGRQLLSYGITSVISLGDPAYRSQARKEAVESGALVGPRAFTTGAHINGSRIYYGFMRTTSNEKMFTNELSRILALGMDQLKTYVRLPNDFQKRAIEAAHENGLPTFSHYFYPSLAFGQDDMAHLSATQRWEFSHTKTVGGHTYQDVIDLATASSMAITDTPFASSTLFNEHPEDIDDPRITTLFTPWQLQSLQDTFNSVTTTDQTVSRDGLRREGETLHKIQQGGGSVWAGTDEPLVHVAQSLHQTLQSQVQFGGFTPYEALRTATAAPTRDVGRGGDLGTVEPGKLADLSFVDGNPLEDIRAAAHVQMVMVGGHLYTTDDLMEPFTGNQ